AIESFGDPKVDAQVATYINGLGNWVRANDCWGFEVNSIVFSSKPANWLTHVHRVKDILAQKDVRYRSTEWFLYYPDRVVLNSWHVYRRCDCCLMQLGRYGADMSTFLPQHLRKSSKDIHSYGLVRLST